MGRPAQGRKLVGVGLEKIALDTKLNCLCLKEPMDMSSSKSPEGAFVLSLIGGIFILVGSVVVMLWAFGGMPAWGYPMGSMMGGYGGMMGSMGFSGTGVLSGMSFLGLLTGILVLVGAVMLRSRPEQAATWGTTILVFSIVSLVGMGGFFIGAVLGFVGGLLALTWRPTLVPGSQA